MASSPRVFTIPASVAFLPALIQALVADKLVPGFLRRDDPLANANATLYLPTRRACRLARDLFLDAMDCSAAVLPRIVPLGDIDEDEIEFSHAALGQEALDVPAALDPLERRLQLAALVARWAASPQMRAAEGAPLIANTPAAALALADDLARLIDDMTTRQVPWDRLDDLVPDDHAAYWQLTLRFLAIAREAWPRHLAAANAIETAARRDLLIAAEGARLITTNAPVIAAGSTGSMPATAALLATIARLPHGAVILPGLDTHLDAASWDSIDGDDSAPGHPQFALHGLLRRIGISRDEVTSLQLPAAHGRERFVSEALRPAATTDRWRDTLTSDDFAGHADRAMDTLTVVEAAGAEEEALAIALTLREAVETAGKTAALVTPDRALARRVLAALGRWHVEVDDSGGDALPDTPAGLFSRLAAEVALRGVAPVPLLALIKHPRFRLAAAPGTHANAVEALECAVLRGPRPAPGTDGLANALETLRRTQGELHTSDSRARLSAQDLEAASTLVQQLRRAVAPLETMVRGHHTVAAFAAAHAAAIEALTRDGDGIAAFDDNDGRALSDVFEDIAACPAATAQELAARNYADLFQAITASHVVRRPEIHDVRVRILGPLEARLQPFDRVVLGGMVEGVWPPETRTDPWLSRPMRRQLGLDLPERRVGLSAHDMAQALGAPEVIVTRAAKLGGAPTVLSRFAQRLKAVAGDTRWKAATQRGDAYLSWARALDAPTQVVPVARPEPRPPVAIRPKQLSVTAVETLLRDPYSIYARHILKLRVLDPVDQPPGARDRGIVIHGAIATFTRDYRDALPPDPAKTLLDIGVTSFAPLAAYPEARAFWWPRFERIARWFAVWETERRPAIEAVHAEIFGRLPIGTGDDPFILTAQADRIEHLGGGLYAVLDYKTGAVPSASQVRSGLAPQLTLEAAMLRHGAFKDIPLGASVAQLIYVSLKGGQVPGSAEPIDYKAGGSPDDDAELALAGLTHVVTQFAKEDTAYHALVRPMWKGRYGDYDHLARVKEWALAGGEEDEA